MPGFANDDTQEVSSPYSYMNQPDPAAQLSQNYAAPGAGMSSPSYPAASGMSSGYTNGPGSGTKNADTGSAATKAPSSSMVDSMSAGYDRSSGAYAWGPEGQYKSTPPPSVYDQNRDVDIRVATKKDEVKPYQKALASMISPETGKPYYRGKIDGRPGSMTGSAVLQFQKDYNLYQDGLIGIAPHGETGPTINEVFSDQITPPMATARNRAVTSEPLSPLEAAAPAVVAPVTTPLETVRMIASGEAGHAQFGSGYVTTEPGDIRARAPVGANEAPGVGVVSTLRPDINARYPVAGDMPARAPTRDFSIADPGPPTRLQEGTGVVTLPELGVATPDNDVKVAREEPFVSTPTIEEVDPHAAAIKEIIAPYTGTRGKAGASRLSPGVRSAAAPNYVITPHSLNTGVARGAPRPAPPASPLEAAAPVVPAADRYATELQKLRQQYGLQPGDNVGPGEQPEAPPTPQEAGFLARAKESMASGRYEPGPAAYGKTPISVGGTPAQAAVSPTSALEAAAPFNVGAGIQPGAATSVLRIMGIMPKGQDRLPGGEAQPNVGPAEPYVEQIKPPLREGRPVGEAPAAPDEAHAANVKQVSDMLAGQPPEKQQAITDHVLIFAHAASLVADAPPEKRAEAFDQQLTRLRDVGAIDDATYQKLHGTTPTDAQLRQMIDLGNAVHEMQGGPQSSLENARGVQMASADNPYNGPVDAHGLPLQTQPSKYEFRRTPDNGRTWGPTQLMNKEEFLKAFPSQTEEDWRQIQDNPPPINERPGGEIPTSDMGGRRQVASADRSFAPKNDAREVAQWNAVVNSYFESGVIDPGQRDQMLDHPPDDFNLVKENGMSHVPTNGAGRGLGGLPGRFYGNGYRPVDRGNPADRYVPPRYG